MNALTLYFTAPRQVKVQEEVLPPMSPSQVLVEASISGISAGTELMIYRGEFPEGLSIDDSIPALSGHFSYPFRYGYSTVGRIIATGHQVDPAMTEKRIFVFHPHSSRFVTTTDQLVEVPDDISDEEAVYLPNVETAVNLVMDGLPLLGENVIVLGQGIVGLLTTAILADFPLASLVTFDRYPRRRQASLALGANASLDPTRDDNREQYLALASGGADLAFEVSGAPVALDLAIALTGYSGRVVIGSWYGGKSTSLDLGGRFHRSRIRLLSSQVTTISPELTGRWTKERRYRLAWEIIRKIRPSQWITHRYHLTQASKAFRLLEETPGEALQVVFTY